MELNKRNAVFTSLDTFCMHAKPADFIEVTEWTNGEGYTINISNSRENKTIDLTWGELQAIKKTVKYLEKHRQ